MAFQILTTTAASITELKRDPMGTFNAGDGVSRFFLLTAILCMRNMGIPQPSVLVIYCLFQAR